MKRKDCLTIACRDIKCKRNFCRQAVQGIFIIVVVLSFFMLIVCSIHLYYQKETADCTEYNVASYAPVRNTATGSFSEDDISTIDLFSKSQYIESTIDKAIIDVPRLAGMPDKAFVNLKYVSILCGQKTYTQSEDEQEVFSLEAVGFNADYKMFSDVKVKAFEIKHKKEPLCCGRFPQSDNEVLVNEAFLQQFLLKESDILNQTVSVYANGINIFSNMTCVGILRNEYINDVKHANKVVLWLMLSNDVLDELPIQTEMIQFIPNKLNSYQKIEELISQNHLENVVFYDSEEIEICCYVEQIKRFADVILYSIAVLILMALFLSLYSTLLNYVKNCTGYYGMLSAIGMQTRDKTRIFYYEFGCIGMIGVLTAFPVGIVLFLITNVLLNYLFVGELHISVLTMFNCVVTIAIFVLALIFMFTAILLRRQFRQPVVKQLKEQS